MIYFIGNPELIDNDIYQRCNIEDCLKYFSDKYIIEVDIETEYNKRNKEHLPNPYEQKVLCIQLGDSENQFVIDTSIYSISIFKELFEDKSKIKIFTNGFFDIRFIYHYNIFIENVYDCFLVERILTRGIKNPKGYLGLAGMCKRYLDVELSKDVRGEIHWRGLDSIVIRYAAYDVKYMSKIREKQLQRIEELNIEKYIKLELDFLPILAYTSYKGFKLDKENWLKIADNNNIKLQEFKKQLDDFIISNNIIEFIDPQFDLFDTNLKCNINWSSSQQVVKLFKKLGINTLFRDKATGKMKDSVEMNNLLKQKDQFEILPIYFRYKEIEKELSTYGEDFVKNNLNPVSGRIHSEFFQILETGRISSSNPNLQNITATNDIGEANPLRGCFIPEKGNLLIVADYSQQEPRVTADKCQDPALLDFIFNGDGDSHSLIGTTISKYLLGEEIKVSKKNNPLVPKLKLKIRDIAKTINLGLKNIINSGQI